MRIFGSFGATSHKAEPETDVHPALRGHSSLWSVLTSIGKRSPLAVLKSMDGSC
jgi:hypothetical protein